MLTFLPSLVKVTLLNRLLLEYKSIVEEPEYTLEKPLAIRSRMIDSYGQSDIPHLFRFRSTEQLRRLFDGLKFPEAILLDNNVILREEETFLFGLRRMCYPNRFQDLLEEFGGEITIWSRAFTWFIIHIYKHFKHLVVRSLERYAEQFPSFAKAIKKKVVEKGCNHITPNMFFRIVGFIDCTIFATARPGGGPACSGVNAPRHPNIIQVFVDILLF
jgi:hypothetical protein